MEDLAHFTFGWHRDLGLAAAAFVVHQIIAVGVVLGLAVLAGTRRRGLWVGAAAAAAMVAFPLVVQGVTEATLYGLAVAGNGRTTAYVGIFYRPVDLGHDPSVGAYGKNDAPSYVFIKKPGDRIRLESRPLAYSEMRYISSETWRARGLARLSAAWSGPRPSDVVTDALERASARRLVVGDEGLTEPERVIRAVAPTRAWGNLWCPDEDEDDLTVTADALRSIGAARAAGLAEEAAAACSGPQEPAARGPSDAMYAEVRGAFGEVDALLEAYVRAHADEIGQPWTGAP